MMLLIKGSLFLDSLLVIVLEAFHFDYKSFEEQMGNVMSEESTFETLLNSILALFMDNLLAKCTAFSSLCGKEQLLSQRETELNE